jgi:Domain of unknown function (DUF1707)
MSLTYRLQLSHYGHLSSSTCDQVYKAATRTAFLYDRSVGSASRPPRSDAERDHAADELRGHYEAGRLTLEAFQHRLDEAHAARTDTQLRHALRQLPSARLQTVRRDQVAKVHRAT